MEKIKVAICEDHSIFRDGIKSHLNSVEGVTVVGEAENGAQLLYMLQNAQEDRYPDIVLLDINMPVMDGMETLKRLKEQHKKIKVIMLTMHESASMVSRMMSLGANSYIPKTEASDQIVGAIFSVHNKDYYFNELTNKAIIESVRNGQFIEEAKEIKEKTEEEKTKQKEEPSLKEKALIGAGYGIAIAGSISLLFYLVYKIYAAMSVMSIPNF